LPAAVTLLRDQDQAWRELAREWKVDAVAGEPCRVLPKEQLQCFSKNLTLASIRELGRPGILTLNGDGGAPSYAVLAGLTRESATLRAAGAEQTVPLTALVRRWHGDFATLWRAPPGYTGRVADSQGQTVDWIAARLAALNGTALPAPGVPFDSRLKSQLRAFQLAHGLEPDGQAGPMTLMQLNRVAGVDEPRLRTEP
jgi:general secretion pathway protein A